MVVPDEDTYLPILLGLRVHAFCAKLRKRELRIKIKEYKLFSLLPTYNYAIIVLSTLHKAECRNRIYHHAMVRFHH